MRQPQEPPAELVPAVPSRRVRLPAGRPALCPAGRPVSDTSATPARRSDGYAGRAGLSKPSKPGRASQPFLPRPLSPSLAPSPPPLHPFPHRRHENLEGLRAQCTHLAGADQKYR